MNIDQAFYYSRLVASMNNHPALAAWRQAFREFRLRLKAEEDSDLWAEIYHKETMETVRLHHAAEKMNAARQAAVESALKLRFERDKFERLYSSAGERYIAASVALGAARREIEDAVRAAMINFCVWSLQAIAAWALVLTILN